MKKLWIIPVALTLILASCISKKKYYESEARTKSCQADSSALVDSLANERSRAALLNEDIARLKNENSELQKNMSDELKKKQEELREKELMLQDLQSIVNNLNGKVDKLKQTITKAMESFKSDEISVYVKDGKVYVSLSEKLLFKSGSSKVDPVGVDALAKLAVVLNANPEINISIEGHTDNVGSEAGNWDLSVMRATSIVKILTDNGVIQSRMIASGRGQFFPVSENETAEGRAKNRRTEIILSPDLKEFFDILGGAK